MSKKIGFVFLLPIKICCIYCDYYHYYHCYCYYYYGSAYLGLVGSLLQYISFGARCTQQPQVSRTCLTIFAVPSNAVFCKSPVLHFTFSIFSHSFNLFDVTPRSLIITGTTPTCDKFQIFFIS